MSAATISYTASNFTASGGDPTYSIATDLTFNNLSLRETFADGTFSAVSLYDFTNTVRTSLDSLTVNLSSLPLTTPDPTHGSVVSAMLTGLFSTTNVTIVTSFGGTPVAAVISPNFSVTLPVAASSININATSGAASYAAGTLQSTVAESAVPEPATYAVASLGLFVVFVLGRRRMVR